MSHLLFMDECGHDGRLPYEVRGGIALEDRHVWSFTRQMRGLESSCFGTLLRDHGSELKAVKLLQPRRIRLASHLNQFDDEERKRFCLSFLGQTRNHSEPTKEQAVAYAQASLLFVEKLLSLIKKHHGCIFASIVPRGNSHPPQSVPQNFVRKDTCFLIERFYYFLEEAESVGLLVLDETDRSDDRRYLSRIERYFSCHESGKRHATLVVPTPLFTASDMSYPVQAADIVIYLVAQGLRLAGMVDPIRPDINLFWIKKLVQLQHETSRTNDVGEVFTTRSIVYVHEPWKGRRQDFPARRP